MALVALTSTIALAASPATTVSNPIYLKWLPVWEKLKNVYDGTGGFMDGTYLVAHPREWKDHTAANPQIPTNKLKARRSLARYENIAAPILDQKRTALFRSPITRTVGGQATSEKKSEHPLETWWQNVDGSPGKCSIDQWMAEAFIAAGLFGHVFHYMDRPAGTPAPTAADEPAVFLRLYAPADVPDWLLDDRGQLTAVRLLEPQPRTDIYKQQSNLRPRERVVTETFWELKTNASGGTPIIQRDTHDFGTLPVVVQYASRRALTPLIGQSVLGDPQLYIDCYNLTSEIRELLRNQTFGMMNVPLGTTADRVSVTEAQTMMGDEKGSENVLFTPGPAAYIQPDTGNVTVYQDERKELIRTIYRLASIPWESDSKDAEAQGSLKLKREDMNQILAGYASECEKAEYQIAKLWFRGQYGESWEAEWDKAEVQINYPQTFDVTPFAELLEQAQAGQALELGRSQTFSFEQSKRLVTKFLPDLPPETLSEIEKELEAAPVKSPAQQKLEEMALRFGGQPGQKPPNMPMQPGGGGTGV